MPIEQVPFVEDVADELAGGLDDHHLLDNHLFATSSEVYSLWTLCSVGTAPPACARPPLFSQEEREVSVPGLRRWVIFRVCHTYSWSMCAGGLAEMDLGHA